MSGMFISKPMSIIEYIYRSLYIHCMQLPIPHDSKSNVLLIVHLAPESLTTAG